MEDERIVELYWHRNERAIDESRIKYGRYCYSIAHNILKCHEDAQECENDTYLAAWNAIPPHRPNALATFLGKLTRRIALDRWKAGTAQKRGGCETTLSLDELMDCIPVGQDFHETLQAQELGRLISCFLRTLPQAERLVFVRRYWHCDSISQISNRFSFSESKVKMMLLRTRKKLLDALRKEGVFYEKK